MRSILATFDSLNTSSSAFSMQKLNGAVIAMLEASARALYLQLCSSTTPAALPCAAGFASALDLELK